MIIIISTIPKRIKVGGSYKNHIAADRFVWWVNEGERITLKLKVIKINFNKKSN